MLEMGPEPQPYTLGELFEQTTPTTQQREAGLTPADMVLGTFDEALVQDAVERHEDASVARGIAASADELAAMKPSVFRQTDVVMLMQQQTSERVSVGSRLREFGRHALSAMRQTGNVAVPDVNMDKAAMIRLRIDQLTFRRRLVAAAIWGLGTAGLVSGALSLPSTNSEHASPAQYGAHGQPVHSTGLSPVVLTSPKGARPILSQPEQVAPDIIGTVGGGIGGVALLVSWSWSGKGKRKRAHHVAAQRLAAANEEAA